LPAATFWEVNYIKMADEIIKELWKIKDAMASEYGYDVKALVAHMRGKRHAGHERVDLQPVKKIPAQEIQVDPTMPS
jgi:hypothetical protein